MRFMIPPARSSVTGRLGGKVVDLETVLLWKANAEMGVGWRLTGNNH